MESPSEVQKLDYLKCIRWVEGARKAYVPPPFKRPRRVDNFIPVLATGGVGDVIVSLGVCAALSRYAGQPVHLYAAQAKAAELLLDSWSGPRPNVKVCVEPFPGFDWWVRLNCIGVFDIGPTFERFTSSRLSELYLGSTAFLRVKPWDDLIRFHPQLDGEVARIAMRRGLNRSTLPYAMLGLEPPIEPYRVNVLPMNPLGVGGRYITVHDGFDNTVGMARRATKTWGMESWANVVNHLTSLGHKVVQIGGKFSRPIRGVTRNLIGATTVPAALQVLAGSSLHIDGDSGFVHASHHMGIKSVALFGPTPAAFFGYPENENLSSGPCGNCFWTKESWLQRCPIGYEVPVCMDRISVEAVLAAVDRQMRSGQVSYSKEDRPS